MALLFENVCAKIVESFVPSKEYNLQMTRVKSIDPIALYFCIFILFVTSMGLWIGWNERAKYIYALIGLIMWLLIRRDKIQLDTCKRNVISAIVLMMGYTYIGLREGDFGIRAPFSFYIPATLLVLLNKKDKICCLPYITRWFSYIIFPGIVVYLLFQTIGFPSFGELLVSNNEYQPDDYTHRINCLFYCYTDFYEIRFNGPFIEPGHLGMMSAFLLTVNGFNFRKVDTWIILTGIFFTLSLSGYMLAIIGFLVCQVVKGKISVKMILGFLLFAFFLVYVALSYNGGDNLLYEWIISRLEPDEENGIAGNNRTFGQVDLYFATQFADRELFLYGYDKDTIDYLSSSGSRGTGFIMNMVKFGLAGTLVCWSFYILYWYYSSYRKYIFLLLVYIIVMYWQRAYPFWFSWIICFVYGIVKQEDELNLRLYENRNIDISSQS